MNDDASGAAVAVGERVDVFEVGVADGDVSEPAKVSAVGEGCPVVQCCRDSVVVGCDVGGVVWRVVGASDPDLFGSEADEFRGVFLEKDLLDIFDLIRGDVAVSLHGGAQGGDVGGDGFGVGAGACRSGEVFGEGD